MRLLAWRLCSHMQIARATCLCSCLHSAGSCGGLLLGQPGRRRRPNSLFKTPNYPVASFRLAREALEVAGGGSGGVALLLVA